MKSRISHPRKILLVFIAAGIAWIGFLALKTPTNDENWQTQFQILPTIELSGDTIRILNVRDFRYNDDDSIAEAHYIDQNYKLSEFRNAWYAISHFADHGLAHVLLSFEFKDDQFLVVSIEARLRKDNVDGYDPIKGLFRGYTKQSC